MSETESGARIELCVIVERDGKRWVYKVFPSVEDEWKPRHPGRSVADRGDAIEGACIEVRRALEQGGAP